MFAPYGLCVAAALMLSALLLCQQMKWRGASGLPTVSALPMAGLCAALGLIGARLFFCACNWKYFFAEVGLLQCFNLCTGGFMLYGAIAGAATGALIVARQAKISPAHTLDMLVLPGMLMISLCRMAEFFPFESVGTYVFEESLHFFPLAVANEYGEWYFAIFVLEALSALVIGIISLKSCPKPGDTFLRALLFYAAVQVVLESLRMDGSIKFGFVRASQAMSAIAIIAVLAAKLKRSSCSVRHIVGYALLLLVCLGGVGGIEWALDKTNVPNAVLYLLMCALCTAMAWGVLRAGKKPH